VAESAPWLTLEIQGLVSILLLSHQRAFQRPLLACDRPGGSRRLANQELFSSTMAVLAHDTSSDPRLIYANATALRLWQRPWQEMIGMPSRYTAEAGARGQRAAALRTANEQDAVEGYCGVRIDKTGQRFMISNARIWTLWDEEGCKRGQAAAFSSWWHL
jgi:hypothetical protein